MLLCGGVRSATATSAGDPRHRRGWNGPLLVGCGVCCRASLLKTCTSKQHQYKAPAARTLLEEHETRRKRLTLSCCALMITTICHCFRLVYLLKIRVSFFISCLFRDIFSAVTGKNKPLLTPLTVANINRKGGFLVKDLSCFVLENLCHTQKAIRRRETYGS